MNEEYGRESIESSGDEVAAITQSRENDGFWGRLADLVTKPARLMDNVGEAPRWWQPLLLLFLVMFVATYVTAPISIPESIEMRQSRQGGSAESSEQVEEILSKLTDPAPVVRAGLAMAGAFVASLLYAIPFSFFCGLMAKLSTGRGTASQMLGIGLWAAVIALALNTLVRMPLVLQTESELQVTLSLAALVPGDDPMSTLQLFLRSFTDLFQWWALVILVVGYERVFGLARQQAVVTVVAVWGLVVAVQFGLLLLNSR